MYVVRVRCSSVAGRADGHCVKGGFRVCRDGKSVCCRENHSIAANNDCEQVVSYACYRGTYGGEFHRR